MSHHDKGELVKYLGMMAFTGDLGRAQLKRPGTLRGRWQQRAQAQSAAAKPQRPQIDQIIPAKPTEAVIKELGSKAASHRYDQGYHMLLRDLDAPLVWQDTLDWIFATKPGR